MCSGVGTLQLQVLYMIVKVKTVNSNLVSEMKLGHARSQVSD